MFADLRLTFRTLSKSRGLAAVCILTLAVGIGASTAMFSTLRALVMNPFDYPDSHELVQVWSGNGWPLSPADYLSLEEESTSFQEFGMYSPGSVNLGTEQAQAVTGARTTRGVLKAFGVNPIRGRLFQDSDEVRDTPPVAIISYGLWQQTYAGDPNLIGQIKRINGRDTEIIGILPADFEFVSPWMRTDDCKIWLPYRLGKDEHEQRDSHYLCAVARLGPGVTVGAAHAEIQSIGKRLQELHPDTNTRKEFLVRSLHEEMTKDVSEQVWMLFGAVGLVLLVACANVASMLLARSAQRQGEFAVRVALGATRGNLIRLALTESLVLASIGAVFGLMFAFGGIETLKSIAPTSAARKDAITLDTLALGFALGATLLTTLLAGIPPAFAAAQTSLSAVIRGDARGSVGSKSRHHMLRALIITQIAVAFVLANGAALFSASYLKILEQNESLSTDLVLTAKLNLRGETYQETENRVQIWEKLGNELAAMPGVISYGLTSKLPLEGGSNTSALVNDEVYDPTQKRMNIERSSIGGDYFSTMNIGFLRGRALSPADDMGEEGHLGVVINQAFVEKAWPDTDPIGQVFRANQPEDPWYTATVVGVVEDVRQWSATAAPRPEMYTTPPGHWGNTVHLNLRSSQPASFLAPQLREVIKRLDRELALENVRTFNQVVRDATASERALTGLVDFFMVAALGLVAVGLYGTLSFHILQRTREIGVRMAIGAMSGDILQLVFRQGLRWVAAGITVGLIGTFALTSILESLVYEMEGLTATPLILATLVVALAATIAIWIPARRASRLDPLKALHLD